MPDPDLGPGHESDLGQYRARARAWLADNLEPIADLNARPTPPGEYNAADFEPHVMEANRALQRRLFDGGYAGIAIAKEYGGQGLSTAHEAAFLEEAATYVMPDFGSLTATTFGICLPTILAHSDSELLREFVPRVLSGEVLICQFFSEPWSGSDLAGARTSATRDGQDWLLNGQKTWSTFAHRADFGLCLARTNWDVPKHQGLTWFLVPCGSDGLTIRLIKQLNGQASFCEDFFDDVRIPDNFRVGEVNNGWTVAQTMLFYERGGGRSDADVGFTAGPGPMDPDLLDLARRRGCTDDPVIRQKLAQAHMNTFVLKAMRWRIAQARSLAGEGDAGLAAYGKLLRGRIEPFRGRLAVEIGGAAPLTWLPDDVAGPDTAKAYLDSRIIAIAGGTNEVQRNGISERVLGMPREPSYDKDKPYRQALRDAASWH